MKLLILSLLLMISTDPREIAKVNAIKKEAEKAFLSADFELAISKYQLLDSMGIDDDAIQLNLAHALYELNDTATAKTKYSSLLSSSNKKLKSIAYQQLGVMQKELKKYEEALQSLKYSIKADPTNEGARYDYELVKKLLEEQKKQEQEQEDQNKEEEKKEDQEKKDQEEENKDNQEGEPDENKEEQEGEKEESDKEEGEKEEGENEDGEEQESEEEPTQEEMMQEKLEEMNISPEKAKMILEAMRNNEVQYLQQQKRKATERPKSDKPDW